MSNRVDPLYLKVATPRVTDSGRNALPSAKDLFKGLSVSSQFKISLHLNRNVTGANNLDGHLTRSGIFDAYSSSSMSYDFFASEAILPGVNFDMTEQPGSYQGMLEYMPTRRVWPDFEVTFYIDDQYNILRLFEEWVNYINPLYNVDGQYSGGSNAQDGMVDTNSYYKLRYPGKYKRRISITKFERSFFNNPNASNGSANAQPLLSYQLIDAFPKQVTAVPLSYDGSTLSRVTIIFGYTRYITVKDNGGKTSSYAGTNNTTTNSKIYMPTQAIVVQSKAQKRALTEGAPQRKNNFPWFNNSNSSDVDGEFMPSNPDFRGAGNNKNYIDRHTDSLNGTSNAAAGLPGFEGRIDDVGPGTDAYAHNLNRGVVPGNTEYVGGISEKQIYDGRMSEVKAAQEAQRLKNQANTNLNNKVFEQTGIPANLPSGSFGISNKGRQEAARNKAQKRDQERNSRRGSAFK